MATVVVLFVAPSITVTLLLLVVRHVDLVRDRVHRDGDRTVSNSDGRSLIRGPVNHRYGTGAVQLGS